MATKNKNRIDIAKNSRAYRWLLYMGACNASLEWVEKQGGVSLKVLWSRCNNGSWMSWLSYTASSFRGSGWSRAFHRSVDAAIQQQENWLRTSDREDANAIRKYVPICPPVPKNFK